jgi:hypothetical protein
MEMLETVLVVRAGAVQRGWDIGGKFKKSTFAVAVFT